MGHGAREGDGRDGPSAERAMRRTYICYPPPSDLPFFGLFYKKRIAKAQSRVVNHRVMKDIFGTPTSQAPISQHWINLYFESEADNAVFRFLNLWFFLGCAFNGQIMFCRATNTFFNYTIVFVLGAELIKYYLTSPLKYLMFTYS